MGYRGKAVVDPHRFRNIIKDMYLGGQSAAALSAVLCLKSGNENRMKQDDPKTETVKEINDVHGFA